MTKLEKKMVKVLVAKAELNRLNKWAGTCYGEQVQAMLKLPDECWEVIYRFDGILFMQKFIDELNSLFGANVEIVNS